MFPVLICGMLTVVHSTCLSLTHGCVSVLSLGYVGTGTNCHTCPAGGTCPGGNRIWPNAGYWNPSEFSGYVSACDPAERCLGGRFSTCRVGHTGDLCSSCIAGYYMDANNLCTQCESSAYISMLLFCQVRSKCMDRYIHC